jgi:endonuclease YncB( thermonuclease family)
MDFHFFFVRCATAVLLFTICLGIAPSHVLARSPLGIPTAQAGEELQGRLAVLQDGDSFVAQTDAGRVTVRISGVDAPERHQAYAANARGQLQQLLHGKTLRIKVVKLDQYQRLVAEVFSLRDEVWIDVGLEQLQHGLAWHYKRYAKEQDFDTRLAYARAEEKARADRQGLWKDLDTENPPKPPWDYRKERR